MAANGPNFALWWAAQPSYVAFASVLLPSVFLTLGLWAVFPRLTPWLLVLIVPLAFLETLYVLRYERASDEHILAILSETDAQEALAWLGPTGLAALALALTGLVLAALLARKNGQYTIGLPGRWRVILGLTGVTAMALPQLPDLADFSERPTIAITPVHAANAVSAESQIDMNLLGSAKYSVMMERFPWGLPLRIGRYLQLRKGMKDAEALLSGFHFDARQIPGRDDDEVYVLVIGETGRPDRWQLNGYERPTNPRLQNVPNVVSFTNAVTSWAWTRMSVPVILSRKPPQLTVTFFPERSVISAFKEAGFWTAWYSMHGALGFHESAVALYANEANDVRFINPASYRSPSLHDEALLDAFEEALARPERKKFIVLHTLGSHFNYAHRYPDRFDVFKPSLKGRRDADLHDKNQREALRNSYDNSILYTDHVLAEVIDRLAAKARVTALLYIADHGENLFDGHCDKSGHGHHTDYDFRTAALWWHSPSFAQRHPEQAANIAARRDVAWSTSNVFPTLLDAAGIDFAGSEPERSLLNRSFSAGPRWTQAGVYFDEADRDPICSTLTQNSKKRSMPQ